MSSDPPMDRTIYTAPQSSRQAGRRGRGIGRQTDRGAPVKPAGRTERTGCDEVLPNRLSVQSLRTKKSSSLHYTQTDKQADRRTGVPHSSRQAGRRGRGATKYYQIVYLYRVFENKKSSSLPYIQTDKQADRWTGVPQSSRQAGRR